MKLLISTLLFLTFQLSLMSQNGVPEIPTDYTLEKKEDYKPYEAKVIELIKWLDSSPLSKNFDERANARKFVSKWINGCPYVSVALHQKVFLSIKEENLPYYGELFSAYMYGNALHALENKEKKYEGTELELQERGVLMMYNSYEKCKEITKVKSKGMEKYAKLIKKEKLMNWLKKNVVFN